MPNNDYVKREDIFPAVTEIAKEIVFGNQDDDKVVDIINSIPAADVEPVRHGHFIGTEFDGYADGNPVYYEWECSECGCVFEDDEPNYRYCPNCGAKMDGEEK